MPTVAEVPSFKTLWVSAQYFLGTCHCFKYHPSPLIVQRAVSSIVLFLYDWILMLPAEIKFVWNTKLRPLNVLYILQRYMPFIDTIAFASTASLVRPMNPDTCRVLVNISGCESYENLKIYLLVVLTVRTWALWENDIRLSFGLPIFFVCCWAPSFYVLHVFLQTQTFIPSPFPQEFGCTYLGGQSVFYLCWVLLTVYEAGKS
ncbi:hypothetical protein EV359DRAFT_36785 [Lentinula novae-zelandiae]|nr:hypothetical protein EV359DRAFT_36785 [Lentinula novae-zelandiae]